MKGLVEPEMLWINHAARGEKSALYPKALTTVWKTKPWDIKKMESMTV